MNNLKITKYDKIYPMINEMVDILYNNEFNNFIKSKCSNTDEKSVFFMFLML